MSQKFLGIRNFAEKLWFTLKSFRGLKRFSGDSKGFQKMTQNFWGLRNFAGKKYDCILLQMSQNFWVLRNYAKNDHSCCHCHSHILWQLVLGLYLMTADQYPSWLNGLITNDAIFLGSQKFCGKIMICLMMTKYKRLSSKCRRNSWVSEILRKNYNLLWRVSGDSKSFQKMTQNFWGLRNFAGKKYDCILLKMTQNFWDVRNVLEKLWFTLKSFRGLKKFSENDAEFLGSQKICGKIYDCILLKMTQNFWDVRNVLEKLWFTLKSFRGLKKFSENDAEFLGSQKICGKIYDCILLKLSQNFWTVRNFAEKLWFTLKRFQGSQKICRKIYDVFWWMIVKKKLQKS